MKGKGSIKFEWERTADTSAFLSLSHTVHSSPFTPTCTKVIIPGDVNGWMDGWMAKMSGINEFTSEFFSSWSKENRPTGGGVVLTNRKTTDRPANKQTY